MTASRWGATAVALLSFNLGGDHPPAAGAPERVDPVTESAVLARWRGPAPNHRRWDLSGLAVAGQHGRDASYQIRLWLLNDKGDDLGRSLAEVRIPLQMAGSDTTPRPLPTLRPVIVRNPGHLPVGEDLEDLAILPADPRHTGLVAIVGEVGPREREVSWLYLLRPARDGLTLVHSIEASPPGEAVGNDGLEGVALTRLGGDTVAVLGFKERPAPTYVRSWLFLDGADGSLTPIGPPRMDRIAGLATQAGATFDEEGRLWVIDRYADQLAVVDRGPLRAALADSADNEIPVTRRVDYRPLERMLEDRVGIDAPLSPFGTAEGIAFDAVGHLFLLSDNNEAGGSVLLVLAPP